MTHTPLEPFGVEVTRPGATLSSLSPETTEELLDRYRVVVVRGVDPPTDGEMLAFCSRLGDILEWEFGAINELKTRPDAQNYLYTEREVPFHWDGAFAGRVPRIIFFHCRAAPDEDAGGETVFCDTTRVIDGASEQEIRRWEGIEITYTTEKVVHYGGSFTAPMLQRHPVSGERILRYAEPVEDLNPVHLDISGIEEGERPGFLAKMSERLRDPSVCYAHAWRRDDIVLADNHALLHGRRPFNRATSRHLRRVNVL